MTEFEVNVKHDGGKGRRGPARVWGSDALGMLLIFLNLLKS